MALPDDDRKVRPNSFGDAAAAQTNPKLNTALGMTRNLAPASVPSRGVPPLDSQAAADQQAVSGAWGAVKDVNDTASRAIADVGMLVPRGIVGAYDTAVVRPMRAAGINAGYLSPKLVPEGVDPGSMTPFTDQKRMAQGRAEQAQNYSNEGRNYPTPTGSTTPPRMAVAPNGPGTTGTRAPTTNAVTPAASAGDNGFQQMGFGVYRKGNTFTDQAGTQDTAFGARGTTITPQNMVAAENLAKSSGSFGASRPDGGGLMSPVGLGASRTVDAQSTPGQFDRAASISALNNLNSPESARLRSLEMAASEEQAANRKAGRGGRATGAQTALNDFLQEMTGGTRQGQVAEMQDRTARYGIDQREQGANVRAALGEFGAFRRAAMGNDVAQQELGMKRESLGFQNRAAKRLEDAQQAYFDAKTPEEKTSALANLQTLQGKFGDSKDRYMAVGGGQQWDNAANAVVNVPQRIFDTRTGQYVEAASGGQGGTRSNAPPAVGSVQNGYRFKGGDPASQASWEKI